MRILPLLLLAVATPALAADPDSPPAEREVRSAPERSIMSRVERAVRSEPAERQSAPAPVIERPRRSEVRVRVAPPVAAESGDEGPARRTWQERPSAPAADVRETIRERVSRSRERRGDAGESSGTVPPPVIGDGLRTGRGSATPVVEGDRRMIGEALRNRIATEGWRREWRRDRRFDWRRHRDRHWNRFNLGIYIDPFGWNYRRHYIGWRLPSRHYSSAFWIHDPWYYSLPPVYGPYRWVRYWDDALLVDLRTGRVVDVIHNFFW